MFKKLYFDLLKDAFAHFDRSEEIDAAEREAFADSVRNDELPNSEREARMIQDALKYTEAGEGEGGAWKRIGASLNEPVEMFKRSTGAKNLKKIWGKAFAIIHAPPEHILAFLWILDSNWRKKKHMKENSGLPRRVAYLPNTHTQTCDIGILSFPVTNRIFFPINVWGRVGDGFGAPIQVVIACEPRDIPESEFEGMKELYGNLVEGKSHQVFVIERVSSYISKVTLATSMDVGGNIPTSIANTRMASYLDQITNVYEVFERRGKDVDKEVSFGLFRLIVGARGKKGAKDEGWRCGVLERWREEC